MQLKIEKGSTFYMFSIAVSESQGGILYKVFLFGSILKALISVSTNLIIADIQPYEMSYDIVPGVLFLPVVVVYVLVPFLLGVFEIVRDLYVNKKKSKSVSKSVLILIGTLISVSIAVISDAIIPHVLHMN